MKISDGRVDSIDFFGSFLVIVTSSACHLYMMNCDEKQTPKFSKKIEGKSLRAARILGDSGVLLVVENASPGNRTGFISSYKISIKTEDSVIETNLIQRKPLPRDLRVSCLCVSSNDLVGIGGSSGEVLVLNISNLQKKFLDRCSHSFIVTSIRILQFGESKKKTCVISGSGDGTVRIAPLIKARNFEDFFYYIINMVAILTLIIALALLIPHQISADIL